MGGGGGGDNTLEANAPALPPSQNETLVSYFLDLFCTHPVSHDHFRHTSIGGQPASGHGQGHVSQWVQEPRPLRSDVIVMSLFFSHSLFQLKQFTR